MEDTPSTYLYNKIRNSFTQFSNTTMKFKSNRLICTPFLPPNYVRDEAFFRGSPNPPSRADPIHLPDTQTHVSYGFLPARQFHLSQLSKCNQFRHDSTVRGRFPVQLEGGFVGVLGFQTVDGWGGDWWRRCGGRLKAHVSITGRLRLRVRLKTVGGRLGWILDRRM